MKLIVGGYAQGKLNFILQKEHLKHYIIYDGIMPSEKQLLEAVAQEKIVIINHFHHWVKKQLLQGTNPEEEMMMFLSKEIESIIISDEIGNGIVPIDAFERAYRERTGKLLIEIASQADEVVRVICGIGQKIK